MGERTTGVLKRRGLLAEAAALLGAALSNVGDARWAEAAHYARVR